MNKDELKQIEERCNAATPGPWGIGGPYPATSVIVCVDGGSLHPDNAYPPEYEFIAMLDMRKEGEPSASAGKDADFIAHSRADIPALLADNKALKGENEKLKDMIQGMGIELTELRVNKLCMDEHERIYEALGCEYEGEALEKIEKLKDQLSKSIPLQQDKPIPPILRAYLNGEL